MITSPPTILKTGLGEIPELSLEDANAGAKISGPVLEVSATVTGGPAVAASPTAPGGVFVIGVARLDSHRLLEEQTLARPSALSDSSR